MSCLPIHGRVNCTACFKTNPVIFDQTKETDGDWRITANPLAWGNPNAEIVVLGFSKGQTQAGALVNTPHDQIAYKKGRVSVGKILAHVGLIPKGDNEFLRKTVDKIIADKTGRFHFGSLIRCAVEQRDKKSPNDWIGSGAGMLDKFVATKFGQDIAQKCSSNFLENLPPQTKLVVMFGMGAKQNYVEETFKLFQKARPTKTWKCINDVAYHDGEITVVHVEHFAAQGALIPNWMGTNKHERSKLGNMAIEAVQQSSVSTFLNK